MKKEAIDQAEISSARKLTPSECRWVFGLTFALVLLSWTSSIYRQGLIDQIKGGGKS